MPIVSKRNSDFGLYYTDLEEAKAMSDRFTNGMLITFMLLPLLCSVCMRVVTKFCSVCCCPYLKWSTFHLPMGNCAMLTAWQDRTTPPPSVMLSACCMPQLLNISTSANKNVIIVQQL